MAYWGLITKKILRLSYDVIITYDNRKLLSHRKIILRFFFVISPLFFLDHQSVTFWRGECVYEYTVRTDDRTDGRADERQKPVGRGHTQRCIDPTTTLCGRRGRA